VFTLWATPFTGFVSVIPAAFLNKIRVDVSRGLDTVGGGDYANAGLIRWTTGSAGWEFDAALTIGSTGSFTTVVGSTTTLHGDGTFDGTITGGNGGVLEIDNGCTLDVLAGGTITIESTGEINVNSGGKAYWHSGSELRAESGSLITWASGSVANVAGTINLASGGLLHALSGSFITATSTTIAFSGGTTSLGGATTVPNGATFLVTGAGAAFNVNTADVNIAGSAVTISGGTTSLGGANTVPSGSTLTCATGSVVVVNGTLTCNSTVTCSSTSAVTFAGSTTLFGTGTLVCASGSVITHASGSQDTYSAGSLVSNGATTTRTGSETRSGAGAWTTGRVATGVDNDVTIDTKSVDVLRCPTLTVTRTWTLDDPGGVSKVGLCITIERTLTGANAFGLAINDNGAGTIGGFSGGTNGIYSIRFCWNGSHWFAIDAMSYTGGNAFVTLP
jgi:filamentous hemagglutinin